MSRWIDTPEWTDEAATAESWSVVSSASEVWTNVAAAVDDAWNNLIWIMRGGIWDDYGYWVDADTWDE